MAVMTISRELGSDGLAIAQQVAQRLGYAFVDKRTTDGIFRQYGLTRFDELYSSAPSFLDVIKGDNLLLVSMANEIVEAMAKRGNVVILGRAAFAVLAEYADVLHVRVQAPVAERVQRVMAREGLANLEAAEERVSDDDSVHRTYVQRFYNKHWDEPSNFDVIIDTGALSDDMAVQRIVEAVQAFEQQVPGPDAVTTATIAVDPVLADALGQVMAYPLPALPATGAS